MHWMLGFVILHVMQVILITMSPEILANKHFKQLCASTIGCSMVVGSKKVHFDSMDPVCNAKTGDDLADALKSGDEGMARLICSGSRRCCSRCTLPLPSATVPGDYVLVRARDELQNIFQLCVGIMSGSLAFQLLVVLIVACSQHAIKVAESKKDEQSLIVAKDTLVKKEHLASRWRVASVLCIITSLVMLVIEMSLLIALVLMPAIALVRNLSCYIYVVFVFVLVIATYCCMGLVIEKYVAFSRLMNKEHTCLDTCIGKAILSVMGSVMWLVVIAGFIIGSVYCAIITANIE